MTKLILVRHAEAMGNVARRFQGQTDADITPKGYKQLAHLTKRLAKTPVDIIYTSDLTRAVRTAEAVRGERDIPIIKDPALREINGGDWEDVPFDELPIRWEKDYANWCNTPECHQMPGGESMRDVEDRVVAAIDGIVKKHRGENVCVTSHGTALKIYVAAKKGLGLKGMNRLGWYDNTAVTLADVDDDGTFDFISEGDISHLPEDLSTLRTQTWWKDTEQKEEK